MADKDSIIVAIELGTSRISGIAGKRKDGSMQILAYAEEKTTACVKRGIVHNIDKTTQSIKSVISKLQASLKLNINQVYVGIGGQSVRSVKSKVRRNMMTQTYINADHIDAMNDESYNVTVPDCELLGNFAQGFVVDSNVVDDPVGVMGTNIEGEYLNVIARRKLSGNIENCFNNTDVRIAETKLSAYELAKNVLTDQEKRAGSALVDLGAGTTTVVVYKNNIVRHLVTLPIGFANITQDLMTLEIDENEAEEVKLKYGNAYVEDIDSSDDYFSQVYTTSFDRKVKISEIQHIIEARLTEIISNVKNQISNTPYANQLLGGIVLTGGGSNMKNIEKAFANIKLNIDKVRIARTLNQPVIKNSDVKNLSIDNGMGNSIISLLISGDQNCVGDDKYDPNGNMFDNDKKEKEIAERRAKEEFDNKLEAEALQKLEEFKNLTRQAIENVNNKRQEVADYGKDKKLRQRASDLANEVENLYTPEYEQSVNILSAKDKNKQIIKEATELREKLDAAISALRGTIKEQQEANSLLNRLKNIINDVVND